MFTTLFGGAILIAALFYLAGWLRLGGYWRVVIAGGLPLTAYLAFALVTWPGLDVVAMHLAVYLALSALLGLVAARRARAGSRLHWAPKLLIAFFVGVFALNSAFIYLASHGMPDWLARYVLPHADKGGTHTAFPGVVPHSDEAAKGIASHLKQQYQQAALGWQIELRGLSELQRGQPARVRVNVVDRSGVPLEPAHVVIALLRPAQERPEKIVELVPIGAGVFEVQMQIDAPGKWVLVLRVHHGSDTFEVQQPVTVIAP